MEQRPKKREQVTSIDQLYALLKSSEGEALFVFDIDNVVTMSTDPALQMPSVVRHFRIVKEILSKLKSTEEDILYSIAASLPGRQLVDHKFLDVLKAIKEAGHKAIALTALLTANFDNVNPVQTRIAQLRGLGVEFSGSFPDLHPIRFESMDRYLLDHPVWNEGILFSNGVSHSKGAVLKTFLDHAGYRPNRVVFVDDLHENVESVETVLKQDGIPCVGIHYTGAFHTPLQHVDEDAMTTTWNTLASRARTVNTILSPA